MRHDFLTALAAAGIALGIPTAPQAGAETPAAGAPHPGGGSAPRTVPQTRLPLPDIGPRPMPVVPAPHERNGAQPRTEADGAFGVLGRDRDGQEFTHPAPEALRALPELPTPEPAPVPDTPGLVRVADASVWPERASGMLLAEFGPVTGYCSAALVGPSTVVTAAHCIYDHTLGWANEITFMPGLNGQRTPPFGAWTFGAAQIVAGFVTEYRGSYADVVAYDLAVVTLQAPVGTWLGWYGFGDTVREGDAVRLRAFPADRPFGTMWQADCTLGPMPSAERDVPLALALHRCPAAPGSSGGGMADVAAMLEAVTVAASPAGNIAVVLGPVQSAWIAGLWR